MQIHIDIYLRLGTNATKSRLLDYLAKNPLTAPNPEKMIRKGRLGGLPKSTKTPTEIIFEKVSGIYDKTLRQDIWNALQSMSEVGLQPEVLDSIEFEFVQIDRAGYNGGQVLASTSMADGTISMGQKVIGPEADRAANRLYGNWWVPAKQGTPSSTTTFTHEAGHALFEGVPD
jgi:hypothetical protein